MAEKRMFAKKIFTSDKFLDLSLQSQALYFHISMNADDEGFVDSPNMLIRMCGAKKENLQELIDSGFVISFESGVIVVKHWNVNNAIRGDRSQPTQYIDERKRLSVGDNGEYILRSEDSDMTDECLASDRQVTTICQPDDNHMTTICQPSGNQVADECQTDDGQMSAQYSIEENSIDYSSIDKNIIEEDIKENKQKKSAYFDDATLNDAFLDYIDMRKKIKAPMTDRAISLAVNKLMDLADGDIKIATEIVNQSIMNSWKGLFPLNEPKDKPPEKPKNSFVNFHQRDYSDPVALERAFLGLGG